MCIYASFFVNVFTICVNCTVFSAFDLLEAGMLTSINLFYYNHGFWTTEICYVVYRL